MTVISGFRMSVSQLAVVVTLFTSPHPSAVAVTELGTGSGLSSVTS